MLLLIFALMFQLALSKTLYWSRVIIAGKML